MRKIILFILALHAFHAEASIRSTWRTFCQRHVTSSAPWPANEIHEARLGDLHRRHPNPQDFIDALIVLYRNEGGQVNRLRVHMNNLNSHQLVQLNEHRDYLARLGVSLRRMLPRATGERADQIFRALLDYEDFERQDDEAP